MESRKGIGELLVERWREELEERIRAEMSEPIGEWGWERWDEKDTRGVFKLEGDGERIIGEEEDGVMDICVPQP